nr:hypothetical protein [Candidatus Levybacteria bacterium]
MDININNSKKVNLDAQVFTTVYRHYKDNILPICVILICVGILFFIIIPQFNNYLKSRAELQKETEKLKILKNNYNFLLSLDDSKANTDFNKLSQVLPANKDFTGIMGAITIAASKTGVSVEDFNFSLGDLDKAENDASKYPSIKLNVNIGGNAQTIAKFITELYKTVPASEVVSIKTTGSMSSLVIIFYYKPFLPQNVNNELPISPLSADKQSLLDNVSSWNSSDMGTFLPDVSASGSGGTNPSPF